MKLLIRNLARTTSEETIKALFEEHGTVESCTIVLDNDTGESKGFGFIEMPRVFEAKAAMKAITDTKIERNKVKVKQSKAEA